ncbi:MAG: tetratricopeptide repeat protein [Oxalobacter sp.]
MDICSLEQLAWDGNIEAQLALGWIYHNGESVQRDDKQALSWWLKAAEAGNPDAQCNVGNVYLFG